MTSLTGRFDWLILSPHLDDAALSCGGTIAHAVQRGRRTLVLTLFAGDEPVPPPTELGRRMVRGWRFPPGRAMAGRRAEDEAACAALGALPLHWPQREAIHRLDHDRTALYPSLESLFGEPSPHESDLLEALATGLAGLPAAARVLAPLGVGGHVDHRLTRTAAEAWRGRDLDYYEDYPYARAGEAVAAALGAQGGWRHTVEALEAEDLQRKCAAVASYRSQLRHLFADSRRMARELHGHARSLGGERLWSRRP